MKDSRLKMKEEERRDRGKSDGRGAMAMIPRDRIDYLLMNGLIDDQLDDRFGSPKGTAQGFNGQDPTLRD